MLLAVVFALAAALSNAVNLLTQHKASIGAPRRVKGWRLALYLPRQPLWLLGVAAAVGSFVFQALALHNGPMSVVQPLLITELVFGLVLRLATWRLQSAGQPPRPVRAASARPGADRGAARGDAGRYGMGPFYQAF